MYLDDSGIISGRQTQCVPYWKLSIYLTIHSEVYSNRIMQGIIDNDNPIIDVIRLTKLMISLDLNIMM